MNDATLGNVCACLGPYGNDPHCPCHMQTLKLHGAYNCYGDKEAREARRKADEERFASSMAKFAKKMNHGPGNQS